MNVTTVAGERSGDTYVYEVTYNELINNTCGDRYVCELFACCSAVLIGEEIDLPERASFKCSGPA